MTKKFQIGKRSFVLLVLHLPDGIRINPNIAEMQNIRWPMPKFSEMKAICKPFGIVVDEVWADGFLCLHKDISVIVHHLTPLGFRVVNIGIGYDYNREAFTVYVYKKG